MSLSQNISGTSPPQLNDLPTELLLNICQSLHDIDRLSVSNLSKTCRRWNSLALPILYQSISLVLGWRSREKLWRITLRDKRNCSILATLEKKPHLWACISKLELTIHLLVNDKLLTEVEAQALQILQRAAPSEIVLDGAVTPELVRCLPLNRVERLTVRCMSWTALIMDRLLLSGGGGQLRHVEFDTQYLPHETHRIPVSNSLICAQLHSLRIHLPRYSFGTLYNIFSWAGQLRSLVLHTRNWRNDVKEGLYETSLIQKLLDLHKRSLVDIELDVYHPDACGPSVNLSEFRELRKLQVHRDNIWKLSVAEFRTKLPVGIERLAIDVEPGTRIATDRPNNLGDADMQWLLELVNHAEVDLKTIDLFHHDLWYYVPEESAEVALGFVRSYAIHFQALNVELTWQGNPVPVERPHS